MSVIIQEETLSDIASAIREKTKTEQSIGVSNMGNMIRAIPTGEGGGGSGNYLEKINPEGIGSFNMNSDAVGAYAVALGHGSHAYGDVTFAEGTGTQSSGANSHAAGQGTTANGKNQFAIGAFNEIDYYDKYAFIIGNGISSSNPKNILTVDWDGNLIINGTLTSKNSSGETITLDTILEKLAFLDSGKDGQFLTSDGKGGTYWSSMKFAEEVTF